MLAEVGSGGSISLELRLGLDSVLPPSVPYCDPLEIERRLTPHCALAGAEPGLGAERGLSVPSSGVGDIGDCPRPASPAPEQTQCPTGGRAPCTAGQHLLSGPLVGWRGSRAAVGHGGTPQGGHGAGGARPCTSPAQDIHPAEPQRARAGSPRQCRQHSPSQLPRCSPAPLTHAGRGGFFGVSSFYFFPFFLIFFSPSFVCFHDFGSSFPCPQLQEVRTPIPALLTPLGLRFLFVFNCW